jgi:hypothetical protein
VVGRRLDDREARLSRTTSEVFDDHLRIGVEGTVEDDIERNYASPVVILSSAG